MNKVRVSLALLLAGLISISTIAAAEDKTSLSAKEVMMAVDQRYEGDTRVQLGTMTLIDKRKNQRVRQFREYTKQYGEDEKSISYVLSPPEVRGTAFLSYEWKAPEREDETWLYISQLRKVKRLASADKSGSFLGSDFTYADLTGLEVEDFDYTFIGEKSSGQKSEWVILAIPKPSIAEHVIRETGYVKVKYWIDKKKLIRNKTQYWLEDGHRVKYYRASNIKKISGIWTVKKMQMVMTQGGQFIHASVFELSVVKYNVPIKDNAFTTYALEREIK